MYPFKSWPQRLLELALALLAAALMLNWAVALLRPLMPVLVITFGCITLVGGVLRYLAQRRRYW